MQFRLKIAAAAAVCACAVHLSAQRTGDSHPDLQGFWTNGTATPLQRPAEFKDKPTLTLEEAAEFERGGLARLITTIPEEDRFAADLNDIYLETSSLKLLDGRRT